MTAQQVAEGIAILIAGVVQVPLMQWLKKALAVTDTSALALTLGVSGVIAFVAMLVTGEIVGTQFTWENLPGLATAVFGVATVVYNIFKGKRAPA
jgi:hypothetical protein